LGLAAVLAVVLAAPALAEWKGSTQNAALLIKSRFIDGGIAEPKVTDTGTTFAAGGVTWRLFIVTWSEGGFRRVAVHRLEDGRYVAIEGLEQEKRWSQAVFIGR
jgi:hypothetical protein